MLVVHHLLATSYCSERRSIVSLWRKPLMFKARMSSLSV
jgi:hypothetical protein